MRVTPRLQDIKESETEKKTIKMHAAEQQRLIAFHI